MKNIFFSLFLFGSIMTFAQASLNDYKYIIVPKTFDDFKRENQYQTSTLIKHLFTEKGFTAVYDDDLPDDLRLNRCLGLTVELDDASSLFTTKGSLRLYDCNAKEVFSTIEARSKEKDYKAAYGEVIRRAFKSFDGIDYKYSGKAEKESPITVSFKDDVKELKEKNRKEPKNKISEAVIKREVTTENQTYKSVEPQESDIQMNPPRVEKTVPSLSNTATGKVLYAQRIPNGYQLVDSTPIILMKIYATSAEDVYMAHKDETKGVLFNLKGNWIFEYYEDGVLKSEELNIKF